MIRSTTLTRNVVFAAFAFCIVAVSAPPRAGAQFPQPRLGAGDPLVVLITSEIAPTSWERAGGNGSIQFANSWGLLFVSQTRQVHGEIDDLLAVVREARNQQNAAAPLELKSANASAARQHLEEEFVTETTLEFEDTPLSEMAETIAADHSIEVVLDTEALEAAGISADMPVTRKLENVSLRTGLWLLLGDLNLSYVVRDDALHITTPDAAESLITRVYNVQDLLR